MAQGPTITTRERMVISAAMLIGERGAGATSIDAVLAHSGAPRGSVYHHFPGGREELLLAAIAAAAASVTAVIDSASGDPEKTLDAFVALWRHALTESDYNASCPVLAAGIERADEHPERAELVAATFVRWRHAIAVTLQQSGVAAARSQMLASVTVAAIEGGVAVSRAERDLTPLDAVHAHLREQFRRELADAATS